MGIILFLGNVGSGKTVCAVREMMLSKKKTYTNIITKKKIRHIIPLTHDKFVIKTQKGTKRDGTPIYDYTFNLAFWKSIKEPIDVIIDEAHTVLNPRRSMSKINLIMTDWLALIRRVLGSASINHGNLIMITQLSIRLDNIARDMATQVRYHIMHSVQSCASCRSAWHHNSELPEPASQCPQCGCKDIKESRHKVMVYKFQNIDLFHRWKFEGKQTFYRHYMVKDIAKYFPLYNTVEWDNLLSIY